jgi:desulfoferrodoxin (superoxide reductase-like protein)
MKGGVASLLSEAVRPVPFDQNRAENISIDDFLTKVIPVAKDMQVYVDNSHLSNFVSMTAPVHEGSASLFKWGNDFAWSYDGDVTDSIKERVKRAGGKVEGVTLRVSLAWLNGDDLDIHVIEPNGNHIYYGAKQGKLDVDMNAGGPHSREPVENIRWVSKLADGSYRVMVNQFTKRENVDGGFTVEIERSGAITTLNHVAFLPPGNNAEVCSIIVRNGSVIEIAPAQGIVAGSISSEKWGLKTLALIKVNSLVLSPNHWGDFSVGNKHWLFILEGCRNPLPVRGIYNEFLHSRLDQHRKVFEVLGSKTKCPYVENQMSGLGFSSNRGDKVTVVASGRPYTVNF